MKRFLPGLIALLGATAVSAQHAHAPHEHGVAALRVAIDGELLQIEFASPLDNLVGFEHAPRTDKQRKALADAEKLLNRFERLFVVPKAAACTVTGVELEHPLDEHAAHEHADNGHDHKHGDKDGQDGDHAELSVTYTLRCTAPAALDTLQVKVFDAFPRTGRIRAERVSPRGQSAATLSAKQRTLAL
ncbi:MAG: DUF2796 domain-containing protein [Betaproteobacteria bacterium HGW-Betaproteobacteria-21]|nr:MAG: DUF2796 domain-containing protein [Betaproteobacteria bacterium HGW-Betaproteobacteria-21]